MRITRKGQVTIPQHIREKAGLLPHTEVTFEFARGKVLIKPIGKKVTRAQRAVERLRGSRKHIRMTTDEIMALTRDED